MRLIDIIQQVNKWLTKKMDGMFLCEKRFNFISHFKNKTDEIIFLSTSSKILQRSVKNSYTLQKNKNIIKCIWKVNSVWILEPSEWF